MPTITINIEVASFEDGLSEAVLGLAHHIVSSIPAAVSVGVRETWAEPEQEREFGHILDCPFSDPESDANPAYSGAYECCCPPPRMIVVRAGE